MNTTWKAVIHTRDGRRACRIEALADGIRALGGEPVFEDPASADGVRFVVAWGGSFVDAAWRGRWRGLGVPVLIMELGYLRRCSGSGDPDGYSQLGFDRIGWFPPQTMPATRFNELGLRMAPPVKGRGKVLLVLGQVPHDAQHNLGPEALAGWLTEHAAAYAAQGWEILYRPHPRHTLTGLSIPHRRLEGGTLEEAFAQAGHVLTYNSTAGIEALLHGLEVVCHHDAHLAATQGGGWFAERFLHRIAWAQWNCAELATGYPLKFLNTQRRILP